MFSIQANSLKFDTLASIQPYLDQLDEIKELEEIRLSGNTLGIEACAGVAASLESKKQLKVSRRCVFQLQRGVSSIQERIQ